MLSAVTALIARRMPDELTEYGGASDENWRSHFKYSVRSRR
jgi:hypothetical protein